MTVKEIIEALNNHCDTNKNCQGCKYNTEENCELLFGYELGETDALLQTEELIRQFTKEWNKESAKRVSRVAMDELISFLRVHLKEKKDV